MEIERGPADGGELLADIAGVDLPEEAVGLEFEPDMRWKADFKRRLLDAYDDQFGGPS